VPNLYHKFCFAALHCALLYHAFAVHDLAGPHFAFASQYSTVPLRYFASPDAAVPYIAFAILDVTALNAAFAWHRVAMYRTTALRFAFAVRGDTELNVAITLQA
jgi:hypothetical protein